MESPFSLEQNIWTCLNKGDKETLNNYISSETAVVYEGRRISTNSLIKRIADIKVFCYTIDMFEVVLSDEIVISKDEDESTEVVTSCGYVHQSSYTAKVYSNKSQGVSYSITTTWRSTEEKAELVYVMIHKTN